LLIPAALCSACRYCVEAPANVCTPAYLADVAAKIAAIAPERFELKVLLRPEVEAMKMGLYLGVAEASETGNDLRFIHLMYKPKGEPRPFPSV
jgi:leucyl aminopeptidase